MAAPDKFRGTATAQQAAAALATGAAAAGFACLQVPLADGGEGTVDAFGGANRTTRVTGPLGDPVEANWRYEGGLAVIEMAAASGLAIAGGKLGNDPVAATTTGTGELVAAAVHSGARKIILAVGGSATTDGGLGAVQVIAPLGPLDGSRGYEVIVACDVCTTFRDAAEVFGPQKGATPSQVRELSERLRRLGASYEQRFGVDVTTLIRAGAGGGLAGGVAALGATLVSGFHLVAKELGLADAVSSADLVLTGEGRLDATSLRGKVVGGVLNLARQHGRRAAVIAGDADRDVLKDDALKDIEVWSLVSAFGLGRAVRDTETCISECVGRVLLSTR